MKPVQSLVNLRETVRPSWSLSKRITPAIIFHFCNYTHTHTPTHSVVIIEMTMLVETLLRNYNIYICVWGTNCEIKFIFKARQEKFKHKNFSLPFGHPSPPTVHCASALCINQTSPISRNTCSIINSNILPALTRQLLKR